MGPVLVRGPTRTTGTLQTRPPFSRNPTNTQNMKTKRKFEYRVDPEDMEDHLIGLEIARVLGLKPNRENGRFETTHGVKTPCGLARTVRDLASKPNR